MIGIVIAHINGIKVFEQRNAIHDDLIDYMHDILFSDITGKFINSATLFDTQDDDAGASLNKDGIVLNNVVEGDPTIYKTAVPTVAGVTAGAIRSWVGTYNAGMYPVLVDYASLGSDLVSAGTFTFTFATYDLPIIVLPALGELTLTWRLTMTGTSDA